MRFLGFTTHHQGQWPLLAHVWPATDLSYDVLTKIIICKVSIVPTFLVTWYIVKMFVYNSNMGSVESKWHEIIGVWGCFGAKGVERLFGVRKRRLLFSSSSTICFVVSFFSSLWIIEMSCRRVFVCCSFFSTWRYYICLCRCVFMERCWGQVTRQTSLPPAKKRPSIKLWRGLGISQTCKLCICACRSTVFSRWFFSAIIQCPYHESL